MFAQTSQQPHRQKSQKTKALTKNMKGFTRKAMNRYYSEPLKNGLIWGIELLKAQKLSSFGESPKNLKSETKKIPLKLKV